jgi:hypothetical protein
VLDFGPVHFESEPTHHTILSAAIGGQISIDRIDGSWHLHVATDRRNADTARRLIAALRRDGLDHGTSARGESRAPLA